MADEHGHGHGRGIDGPPAEGDRLLAKDAAAALNGPADVDQNALKGRLTGSLLLSVAMAACGSSFIFGYNIGNINPPSGVLKPWILEQLGVHNGSTAQEIKDIEEKSYNQVWAWTVSLFPLGGIFGGILCGVAADRFGRKGAMFFNNFICLVGTLFLAASYFATAFWMLLVGRFIIGFNCGMNSGLAPMYLMEISPVNLRGMLGSVNQLMVTVSITVASILGLSQLLSQPTLWWILFALIAVPAIWQLISLPFCPESPKYLLIVKHQREEAEKALKRLRNKTDVSAELKSMQDEADKMAAAPKVAFADMFKKPILRWALTIAVMMMLAQQFSGINAAFYFSNKIFTENAKLSNDEAQYATLGMCIVNVVMTIVSTLFVDRFGRRLLLLIGMGGMWVCSIVIVICLAVVNADLEKYKAFAYVAIGFIYLFVISFATGPGSIPWFYVSEIFDQGARGNANAVAVMTNWLANFLVGFGFGPWADLTKSYAFLIFTGFLTFFWIFTFIFAPETKNRKLEDLQEEMKKKAPPGCR